MRTGAVLVMELVILHCSFCRTDLGGEGLQPCIMEVPLAFGFSR